MGLKPLQNVSELLKFDDLLGFGLTSHRCNFRSHRAIHQATQEQLDLPENVWKMLHERCPNLEELVLNGYQDHLWRVHRVSDGQWPRLRKLSLGFHPGGINNYPPFRQFLVNHPRLRDITLTGLRFEPWDSSDGTSFANLPSVTHYTGFWPIHRSTVPYPMYRSIQSVTAHHITWIPSSWMMHTVFPTLHKKLPSLTSISLSVEFRSRVGATDLDFFHALFAACPNLEHLEIVSSSHFDMHDFAAAIQHALCLRSFNLVKVSRITDEDMTKSAIRVLRHRPELSRFSIAHVCPWRRSEQYFMRQKGVYETLPGIGGMPSAMVVRESAHRKGQLLTRRYRVNLPFIDVVMNRKEQ
ncbi:hypothetical protein HGRIS_001766 [Hohenbuehelia grisea]|uniref:Uncharacterized protein n=1 Tax=Hohenbuehelia grisea TaxID=104357 RepID=A0ABR3JJE2_9AGAR